MSTEAAIKHLLRWRMARAETEAPRAPGAAQLLELSRPWWETWPERFQLLVERLRKIQVGYAMAEPGPARTGHPVSTLIEHSSIPLETTALVLYIEVRGSRLRLRFQLDKSACHEQPAFETTFVCCIKHQPLFATQATRSVDSEYRVETELPGNVAKDWTRVRVTDQMPFSLILRPANATN
jgi:hypothetical protein